MEIYLVRHGQSMANAGLTADLDSPLTEIGEAQAKVTAERLSTELTTPDPSLKGRESHVKAYVSPLVRTLQTVEPICRRLGIRATAFPQVCEYWSAHYPDFLTFEGLTSDEIKRRFPLVDVDPAFPCVVPWWPRDFENRKTAFARAVQVRDNLLSKYGHTPTRILIVSHSDPIGHLIEAFTRVDPQPDYPVWSDNCSITKLIVTDVDGPAAIAMQNDVSHLGDLATVKVW